MVICGSGDVVDDSIGCSSLRYEPAGAAMTDSITLTDASIALRDDLLNRAEWCPDAGKVVCAGNSAWFRFNEAIDAKQNTRAPDDVAKIVAWLRGPTVPDHSDEGGCPFDKAAACIERGDWKDQDDG